MCFCYLQILTKIIDKPTSLPIITNQVPNTLGNTYFYKPVTVSLQQILNPCTWERNSSASHYQNNQTLVQTHQK